MCPHLNDRSTEFTEFKRNSPPHPDELMGAWHILEAHPIIGRVRRNRFFHNNTEDDDQQHQQEEQDRLKFEQLAHKMVKSLGAIQIIRDTQGGGGGG